MMTRAEIQRHVRGILRLRENSDGRARVYTRGYDTPNDFDPKRRKTQAVTRYNVDAVDGAVDVVFAARERSGRLPRGSW